MTDTRIYLYANCSSCRKADAQLAESGIDYARRDIFKHPLTIDEISELLAEIGKSPDDVLSRRSIPFRQLGLADRKLADDELIQLMSEHPALLRRPIIISGSEVLVGYSLRAVERVIAHAGAN